jgi:hypothetical protein
MSSTKQKLRLAGAFAALAALALAVSCTGFFPNPTITSFTISPTSPTVPLGGTTQMHAFGTDSNNNPTGDITSKITWSSKNNGVVSVSSAGLLSGAALSTSTVEIDANYQALSQQSANASVCVDTVISGTFLLVPSDTSVSSTGIFPNGGGMTASVQATVNGATETLDVTAGVVWSANPSADMTITNGVDPATVLMTVVTTDTPVTVTATYTCNTTTITQSTTITLTP